MPRWLMYTIFITVGLAILGGVHFYLYRRLIVAPVLGAPWRTMAMAVLLALPLGFPLSFLLGRTMDLSLARYMLYPIYTWLGVMMMLFFLLLTLDLLHLMAWGVARLAGLPGLVAHQAQRLLLMRLLAGGTTAVVLLASAVALVQGLGPPLVRRVEVTLPHLPVALDGFTIVQLTDLHLGPMRGGPWLEDVVRRTNALKPDLVAITGDLADATVEQLDQETKALAQLQAPQGVFFVTGNHEYFIDLEGWLRKLGEMGVRVLRNERVEIRRGEASFDLAGVDDHEGGRMAAGHGADVAKALEGLAPERAVVLLAHQPRAVKEAARHGAGLVLAGHTHGGQIWPWRYLVYLQQPYVNGLHDHQGTQIYVSEGTGFWGPPMRLGSRAEVTQVILRAPLP